MMINLSNRNASQQSNLQSLAREMLQYASRQCPHIDERTSLQKHKLIDEVNGQLQRQNAIIRAIGLQLNEILMEQANKREALQEIVDELNEQIQLKTIDMENLQEAATHLENKVANYRDEYSKLKNFAQNLAECQKQAEKVWEEERDRMRAQIMQLKQTISRNNQLVCKLSSEKELILAQFKQQRANIQCLNNQIAQLQLCLQKEKEKLRTEQVRCQQLFKQKEKLISKYQMSQQALNNVKKDVQFLKYGLSFEKINVNVQKPPKMVRHNSGQDISLRKKKIYWQQCQNLPYRVFNPFDWQRSNPEDKNDFKNGFRCLSLDPYFAHFVLTSQSVKIKEDCEQLLNIDVKPYYNQIVQKRIPMHLWDQWIRNRLRELRRKIRKPVSNEMTSEDDHST